MADENTNPGGEGATETPGKPGGDQGTPPPSSSPTPNTVPATTADRDADKPADTGNLATDARTVADEDGNDRRVIGDPDAPLTAVGDPEGKITNRDDLQGTLQREPTPEELPADAKIAPLAEQVNPNSAAQAVGALDTPETIAGVDQPEEGEKNVVSDASDATQFLPPDSDQHELAERASEDAERDADRGRK